MVFSSPAAVLLSSSVASHSCTFGNSIQQFGKCPLIQETSKLLINEQEDERSVATKMIREPKLVKKYLFFESTLSIAHLPVAYCSLPIDYLATFTALFSLITVTLIWPGNVISVCIFCAISKDNFSESWSVTLSASTITRNSRPACIA